MRKDSELFLKKILEYRSKINKDEFQINYLHFSEIPSIRTAIFDILKDLINNNCITSQSRVTDIEGDVSINLTMDGITYFDDVVQRDGQKIIFNVSSGGSVNLARDNGRVEAIQNNQKYDIVNEKLKVIAGNENDLKAGSSKHRKKVFISYSWVPESNKSWVANLAKRLESDGVEVIIDYKDLKLGYDVYAFMQRTVNDDTIDKVLIICNSGYKYKADHKQGGVGDESAIITPQIYGNAAQRKFIPVVNEKDENGKPFLPNYLSSRMYADLTDFETGYKILLENISERN